MAQRPVEVVQRPVEVVQRPVEVVQRPLEVVQLFLHPPLPFQAPFLKGGCRSS